jgi:hypothetical protein
LEEAVGEAEESLLGFSVQFSGKTLLRALRLLRVFFWLAGLDGFHQTLKHGGELAGFGDHFAGVLEGVLAGVAGRDTHVNGELASTPPNLKILKRSHHNFFSSLKTEH